LLAKGFAHLTLLRRDDGSSFQLLPRAGSFCCCVLTPSAARPEGPSTRPVAGLAAHPDLAPPRPVEPGRVAGAASCTLPGESPRRIARGTVRGSHRVCIGMFMAPQLRKGSGTRVRQGVGRPARSTSVAHLRRRQAHSEYTGSSDPPLISPGVRSCSLVSGAPTKCEAREQASLNLR